MTVTPGTLLKGVSSVGYSLLNDQLESNLVQYFNWAILNAGGFYNVYVGSSGAYGGNKSVLRLSNDNNYLPGQAWEGYRMDWVWESGINYSTVPIVISGVYLNGSFLPVTTTGNYAYTINYPLGRVIFNNVLPTNSVIQVEHSYRQFSFLNSNNDWYRQLQYNSQRVDDPQFLQQGSGSWSMIAQNRVQMPAVVVEAVPQRSFIPYQIGGGSKIHQDVDFHIFAETSWDRKQLIDIITYQWQQSISTFDLNLMAQANAFPLDYNGNVVSGALMYPALVSLSGNGGYYWRYVYFYNMRVFHQESYLPLFTATVRATPEIDMPEI